MGKLKRFIKYYIPYKKIFFIDMTCAFAAAGVDLLFPVIVRFLLDEAISKEGEASAGLILKIGFVLLGLYFVQYACNYYVTAWGHIMGARMEYDMRNDIFIHLQKLSFSFYDNNKTGQLMSRIVNDLFDISELAHHGPEEIFISIIKILGSFLILLSIDYKLTLIVFAFIPPMAFFAYIYNKKMKSVFMRNRQKIANVNSQLEDSISGVRVVKSFTNENVEMYKFIKGNEEFLHTKEESYGYMGRFFSGITLFQGIIYVITVISGTLLMRIGSVRPTDLVAFLLYINTLLNPIRSLINFTEQFQKGMTGFERFLEIINTEPDIEDSKDSLNLNNVKGKIEFKDVSFKYDTGSYVLKNINLNVSPGETVALVGPSGGGKSTICSLIPRFYEATEGLILLDDINIKDIKLKSLRQNIGIVQQDVYLFAGTVMDNIRYGKTEAAEAEIIEAAKQANAHDFIMELEKGYHTYVGERGAKLSGGQKQRISIARVFLKNPPVLILDEATSALDNQSERIVQDSLKKLSENRTTFVIAHRLSTIKNAKNILVLTDDGIVERGSHHELLKNNGVYTDLYYAQYMEDKETNS